MVEATLGIPSRLVVHIRSRRSRREHRGAELHTLDRRDAAHRLCDEPVDAPVPVHVTAKSGRNIRGDHIRGTAECVTAFAGRVDGRDHPRRRILVRAPYRRALDRIPRNLPIGDGDMDIADPEDARVDFDADRAHERPAHRTRGHPCGGLASARALEDVAGVAESIFEHPGEVGVSGADPGHRLGFEAP